MDGNNDQAIKVKREIWKDGKAHSVARNPQGHIISWRKWHGRESTQTTTVRAREIVYSRRNQPKLERYPTHEEYKAKPRPMKQFVVVAEYKTVSGATWYEAYQSTKPWLHTDDLERLRTKFAPKHSRQSDSRIYDEIIPKDGVRIVYSKDLLTGEGKANEV
ncbi:MAG: hypothetical protein A2Z74_04675 [Chloroflexi bacterium RBG_13_46_9]|nr:MAG: hypothetical protein A2Z74_04675 [Chloroflexi bacterium RBG_13_46_9]